MQPVGACSSVGEHLGDIEGVVGSNPTAPTIPIPHAPAPSGIVFCIFALSRGPYRAHHSYPNVRLCQTRVISLRFKDCAQTFADIHLIQIIAIVLRDAYLAGHGHEENLSRYPVVRRS